MDKILVNEKEYEILSLLGKGKGGYSYLARGRKGLVVVKQIHHEPCDYYTFGNKLEAELRDYRILKDLNLPIPLLLDVDEENERIVKEYVEGPTVMEKLRQGELPGNLYDQMEKMCEVLYPAGLNIDYFPTNFVVSGNQLFYIDFECNPYDEQWDFEHWGKQYWSHTPALDEYLKNN